MFVAPEERVFLEYIFSSHAEDKIMKKVPAVVHSIELLGLFSRSLAS